MENSYSKATYNKPMISFYRKVLIAYLFDNGVNMVPAVCKLTGMPVRTVQDSIIKLSELNIECIYVGARMNGHYKIKSWGLIDKSKVKQYLIDNINAINLSSSALKLIKSI